MPDRGQINEITERLEQGVQEFFNSDRYTEYLKTMSQFHTYSFNNTLLIAMQRPDATLLQGYQAWQKKFNRQVRRGEKGIQIIAPAPVRETEEREKRDENTGEVIMKPNGEPETEEVVHVIPRFRMKTVFDVSQTDGDPLPDLGVGELTAGVENYDTYMGAVRQVSPVPIRFGTISGEAKGYYDLAAKEIVIKEGMSESQTLKTAVHETVHARLHDRDVMAREGVQKDRMTQETEADSIAYTVCSFFNIDTSDYTFPYVASWSSGRDLKELRSSMDTIRNTSAEMIDEITGAVQNLEKEQIRYEEVEIFGVPMLYSDTLIAGADVPEGLYSYQLRGSDDDPGIPSTIENFVRVNHAGTVMGSQQLPVPQRGYLPLGDTLNFTGEEMTVQEYRQRTAGLNVFDLEQNMTSQIQAAVQENAQANDMPDNSIGLVQMHDYGYLEDDMYPLTRDRALQLQESGVNIYFLHTNGRAPEMADREMIDSHRGIFGIRREDWEELQSEDKLLHGNEDRYGIYQIGDDSVGRDYRFLDLNLVTDRGYVVNHNAYQLMYSEELKPEETLDSLYYRFNEDRPADFIGHSLSVSDVVVLNRGGDVNAFYVNDIGFRELPDFFKDIEAREHVTEFTSGLEVEGHVGTWHTIDQTEVSGEKFFLMEHDEYGDSAAGIIVNEEGKLVAEDVWNGFTTDVMDSIDEYLDDRENAENGQELSAESEKAESEKQEEETTVKEGKEEKAEKADVETEVKDEEAPFTPVYMHDAVYARENGERDQYFASRRENVACREAIEKAVNENFDGMYLNGDAAKSVVSRFGPERVEYVLATTVQQLDWDGRFSKNNKDWAKSIPTVEDLDKSGDDRRWEYVVTSHPAVLDGFIRLARQEILEQEQTHEQEQSQEHEETADISPTSDRMKKLGCLHGQSMTSVEETVLSYAQAAIDEMGLTDEVQINAARVYGSRSREGLYSASSDLDVVLSYTGNISEDDFYNVFHEKTFSIAGLPLDINPISTEETGTLEDYLKSANQYLDEQAKKTENEHESDTSAVEPSISFYVAECMEFPVMGEYHEGLTLQEAIEAYQQIPAERMNGIKGIGCMLTDGSMYDGLSCELVAGNDVVRDMVHLTPHYEESPLVQQALNELEKALHPERETEHEDKGQARDEIQHDSQDKTSGPDMQNAAGTVSEKGQESRTPGSRESVLKSLREHQAKVKEQDKQPEKTDSQQRRKGEQSL